VYSSIKNSIYWGVSTVQGFGMRSN